MGFSFKLKKYQLKVFSAILSNLVVLWLGFARKPIILTADIILAIVALILAFNTEKKTRNL